MFTQLRAGVPGQQAKNLAVSLILHGLLLGWLLHSPHPKFLAPSSLAIGEYGTSITHLYWSGHLMMDAKSAAPSTLQRQSAARERLTWNNRRKSAKALKPSPAPSTDAALAPAVAPSPATPAPAGVPYGTLAEGPTTGDEIRPALPVVSSDPVVDPEDLPHGSEGSVVVEITIDEKGEVIQKVVLQSLGPAVDTKVLAALENWHFRPATRNGVAIASKQDVYYHFKAPG